MTEELEQLSEWRDHLDEEIIDTEYKLKEIHDFLQYLRFQRRQIDKEMTAIRLAQRGAK